MKKLGVIILLLSLFSCSNTDDPNSILPYVPVNETVYLNNPSNNNLLSVGGWVEISGGIKGIVVYHAGIENYLAYDLACPHLAPSACSKMIVEDGLNMENMMKSFGGNQAHLHDTLIKEHDGYLGPFPKIR